MKVATYFYVGLIIIFLLSACSLPGPQAAPLPQQAAPSDPEPEVKRPTTDEIKGRTINNQFKVPIPITETFSFTIPPSWTGNYIVEEFSSTTKRPPRQQPLEGKLDVPTKYEAHFMFAPNQRKEGQSSILTIFVMTVPHWNHLSKMEGPPLGDVLAQTHGLVYAVSLPQSNPYDPATPDGKLYGQMVMSLDQVKKAFSVQ
ncbi:hypothetical protein [Brevibacillus sp. DP1.3A]|uniref:hypothetical protein n=1 Tax=unclassified Brevibacillus TaxID=2684853 RepID=UPI00156BBCAF|nr:hypothetical protein [Brevibacillus sp. DP1.3A]UED76423.1 hypothetical protein HP399_007995 [Brevibacillus sp. DP1.3A]